MYKQQTLLKTVREASPEDYAQISQSPWDNVYWFARMLIASDKYGSVGTDTTSMAQIASAIYSGLARLSSEKEEVIVTELMGTIRDILHKRWGHTKKVRAVEALCEDLSERLLTPKDFQVLALTCERVMVPVTRALDAIPGDDRAFAESIAEALLKARGEAGLSTVINLWDDLGLYGCMTAERAEVVQAFGLLRKHLADLDLNETEENLILTAFCQEFERRVGQKRKGRAGRGVESITSLILTHFGFERVSEQPEHFTTGLEIDRWVKCRDGWYIGISCKRTLRERWKQAYTTDINLLNRHKIKALWHVLTFDNDLSDDKLTEMGSHRAIFYLADDSPRYHSASRHSGMRDYVRPMSAFVADLAKEIG
jgi:hypothetical protein